jgi:hypothetical protein
MANVKQPNGYATRGRRVSEVVMQIDEIIQKEENIFLFLPNIIGKSDLTVTVRGCNEN